jgi:hypothetical protein
MGSKGPGTTQSFFILPAAAGVVRTIAQINKVVIVNQRGFLFGVMALISLAKNLNALTFMGVLKLREIINAFAPAWAMALLENASLLAEREIILRVLS